MSLRLGELLVRAGYATPAQIDVALHAASEQGCKLGTALVRLGYLDRETLARALGKLRRIRPLSSAEAASIDVQLAKRLPPGSAYQWRAVPIRWLKQGAHGGEVLVAFDSPPPIDAIDELSFVLGAKVIACLAPEDLLDEVLDRYYPMPKPAAYRVVDLSPQAGPVNGVSSANESLLRECRANLEVHPEGAVLLVDRDQWRILTARKAATDFVIDYVRRHHDGSGQLTIRAHRQRALLAHFTGHGRPLAANHRPPGSQAGQEDPLFFQRINAQVDRPQPPRPAPAKPTPSVAVVAGVRIEKTAPAPRTPVALLPAPRMPVPLPPLPSAPHPTPRSSQQIPVMPIPAPPAAPEHVTRTLDIKPTVDLGLAKTQSDFPLLPAVEASRPIIKVPAFPPPAPLRPPPSSTEIVKAEPDGLQESLQRALTTDKPGPRLEGLEAAISKLRHTVASPEEVADVLIETLEPLVAAVLVLLVKHNAAMGWKGRAAGVHDELIESVIVPLGEPSVIARAAETLGVVVEAPRQEETAVHRRFWRVLSLDTPEQVAATPVMLNSRVVNVIYVHPKPDQPLPENIGEILAMLSAAAQEGFARLIQARKLP